MQLHTFFKARFSKDRRDFLDRMLTRHIMPYRCAFDYSMYPYESNMYIENMDIQWVVEVTEPQGKQKDTMLSVIRLYARDVGVTDGVSHTENEYHFNYCVAVASCDDADGERLGLQALHSLTQVVHPPRFVMERYAEYRNYIPELVARIGWDEPLRTTITSARMKRVDEIIDKLGADCAEVPW